MISLEECKAYLSECQALPAEAKLSLGRATAVMAVCHAWLALRDAVLQFVSGKSARLQDATGSAGTPMTSRVVHFPAATARPSES
jgi:hypothetical protein